MDIVFRDAAGRPRRPVMIVHNMLGLLIAVSSVAMGAESISAVAAAESVPPTSRTFYVDPQIREASCRNYSVSQRRCGGGSETAFRDPNRASSATRPGDRVWIREGVYTDSFAPENSGTAGMPIQFRRYRSETVRFSLDESLSKPAIILNDRHHLVLDGLTVDGAWAWAQLWKSTDIHIENATFRNALDHGSRGGFRMVDSERNVILNSLFEEGNDSLMLEHSSHNLVQGNRFHNARHTLLVIACGSYNVIRGNEFHNDWQKAGETFDCEGQIESLYDDTRQVRRMESTRRNVWERNRFLHTRESSRWYKYNALQYAGQHGIVRQNVFVNNLGGGIGLQMYADEATYNYGNHIYHNTLYNNRCFGILGGSRSTMWRARNIVVNNLLSGNRDCVGKVDADIVNHDWIATKMAENVVGDPGFVDARNQDFHLRPDSKAIDRGVFLTRTVGTGSNSTTLKVEDAGYFVDGYGIPGLKGDEIRLDGGEATAVIVSVDDDHNILHLDRPLSWSDHQGVALRYRGKRPDAGAYELQ